MEENRRLCHNLLPVFYSHAFILIFSAGGISLIPWVGLKKEMKPSFFSFRWSSGWMTSNLLKHWRPRDGPRSTRL